MLCFLLCYAINMQMQFNNHELYGTKVLNVIYIQFCHLKWYKMLCEISYRIFSLNIIRSKLLPLNTNFIMTQKIIPVFYKRINFSNFEDSLNSNSFSFSKYIWLNPNYILDPKCALYYEFFHKNPIEKKHQLHRLAISFFFANLNNFHFLHSHSSHNYSPESVHTHLH